MERTEKRGYMHKVFRTLVISTMVGGIGMLSAATGTAFANSYKPPQSIVSPANSHQPPQSIVRPDTSNKPPQ
jgi:hypothetical protein